MSLRTIGSAFIVVLALLPLPAAAATCVTEEGGRFFPRGRLFEPLVADPRWPHFSASYQRFVDDEELENTAAVSFGEAFGLVRWGALSDGCWQLDFQAGVFALFDLDAESMDLINADYLVGIPLVYRNGGFAAMFRFYHQSSHLGDEFLLRSQIDRVNLSYEGIDLKFSYKFTSGLRLYAGGGYLLSPEPELDPLSGQLGVEYQAPSSFWGTRPIAAIDLQSREESGWRPDLSVRAGVQFESADKDNQRVQLLFEYFRGRNPNGQFYERTLEYFGIGLHVQLLPAG